MIDRPSERMRRRVLVWITLIMAIIVAYTIYCIFKVSVKESRKWQSLANSQQLTSTTVTASRGTIYDSNDQVLAQSATVYNVYSDNAMLWEHIDAKDKRIEELNEAIKTTDDADKREAYAAELAETKTSSDTYNTLLDFISEKLGMSRAEIAEMTADRSVR